MPRQHPILFFPGVMASRLYFPASGRYWDPDCPHRMLRWAPIPPFRSDDDNRRDLHFTESAGVVVEAAGDDPASERLGWGGVVWSCYGGYLAALRDLAAGGNAFAVGYDWRCDLRALGEYAADKIRLALRETGAGRVDLVAHSMGGLVVRAALRAAPDLADSVARVLFVCQPAAGAVVLYRRLFSGLVPGLDGGRGVKQRAFRLLLGDSRHGFVGNMSGMPGPLQLLPSRHFPPTDGVGWHGDFATGLTHPELYLHADCPPGVAGPSGHPDPAVRADFRNRVEETAACHDWLGPPTLPETIRVRQVAGGGLLTDVTIRFDEGVHEPGRSFEGDSTVPLASATAMRLHGPDTTHVVRGLEHGDACLSCEVVDLTRQFLSQGSPTESR